MAILQRNIRDMIHRDDAFIGNDGDSKACGYQTESAGDGVDLTDKILRMGILMAGPILKAFIHAVGKPDLIIVDKITGFQQGLTGQRVTSGHGYIEISLPQGAEVECSVTDSYIYNGHVDFFLTEQIH